MMDAIKKEIEHWERLSEKYQKIGMNADHNPLKQEGLLVKAETYLYCAYRIKALLKEVE